MTPVWNSYVISWYNWEPLGTTEKHCQPLRTITNHWEPLPTIENHCHPLRTIAKHWEPLRTTKNHYKPLVTIVNHWEPLRTTKNRFEPLRTIVNPWESLPTTENHWEPLFWKISVHLQTACEIPLIFCKCARSASVLLQLNNYMRASMGKKWAVSPCTPTNSLWYICRPGQGSRWLCSASSSLIEY